MGKKDAHIFVLLHNDVFIWRLHTSRPDGNVTSVAPKLFSVFSNFLEKKARCEWKGLSWRSRSDTRLYMYSCVFVFFLVCLKVIFFSFPKKGKQKTEGNCAPYGGLGENVPVTHLYVFLLVSLIRVLPCFVQWTLGVSRLSHVCVQLVNSQKLYGTYNAYCVCICLSDIMTRL